MEIHLFDFLGIPKINLAVDIKKSLKDKIKFQIYDKIYVIANEFKIKPTRLYEYFIWQKSAIPLKILFKLSNKLAITEKEIEKNLTTYKQLHVPLKNSIKNPIFPIKVSPYLTSITANLFFDGSVPEDGKGTYYNQKNKKIMEDFIKRVIYSFGDTDYSLKLDHKGVLKCRLPRIVGEICRWIYNINFFGTFNAEFPSKIYQLDQEHKKAFVLAAIIDEGSIAYDGNIIFGICNKSMCEGIRNLCIQIGLNTDKIRNSKNSSFYYFHINSIDKFYKLIKGFSKKYPFLSLRYKEERLKKALDIRKNSFNNRNLMEARRNQILKELQKRECTINYFASTYLIPPRIARRDMYFFLKAGKVFRKKNGNEYVYALA